MKKYLALAALVFTSNAYAMEPTTEAKPTPVEAENTVNQLTNELIATLKAQGCSDTEILSFALSIKKFKDAGLTDRQIMQRLGSITGKGSLRTTRRNNRQAKVVAILTGLGCATVVGLIAWYFFIRPLKAENTLLKPKAANEKAILTVDNAQNALFNEVNKLATKAGRTTPDIDLYNKLVNALTTCENAKYKLVDAAPGADELRKLEVKPVPAAPAPAAQP